MGSQLWSGQSLHLHVPTIIDGSDNLVQDNDACGIRHSIESFEKGVIS